MFLPINCFYKKGCFSKVFELYFNVKEQTQIVSVPLYQQEGRAVYSAMSQALLASLSPKSSASAAASRLNQLALLIGFNSSKGK